jgi:predicted metal-binding membrane protein
VIVALAWAAIVAGVASHGAMAMNGEPAPRAILAGLPGWTLMAVAMMVPIALPALRHVGLNSIRRRRQWAMALYFAAYVALWALFGILVLAGAWGVRQASGLDDAALLPAALAVAAGWQLTRAKRRALIRCRRTVALPPVGRRADAGCVRFALAQGQRCVTSCWALMAVVAFVDEAALVWMAGLTALIPAEELTRAGRRLLRPAAGVLACGAVAAALLAPLSQPTGADAHRGATGHSGAAPRFLCAPRGPLAGR